MRCDEIMKKDIHCVRPDESVQTAALRMRSADVGFLPVCDDDGRALGTITDRDIAVRFATEDKLSAEMAVSEIMTTEVVCCRPGDDLREAERLMSQHRKSRIMVTDDDDKVVGVISLSDIAEIEDGDQAATTLRDVASRETHVH